MPTSTGHTRAIAASKVTGTHVYNTRGDHIGHVEDVVLDKMSNEVMFAVLGFGGFLGIGEKYHAMPWSLLDYDENKGGYVVGLAQDVLKGAPAHSLSELIANDGAASRTASEYYSRFN